MEPNAMQMEQLKKIELVIFREFIGICEKLNLKYYVLGGTLLGAVRHNGFIPWDDDIDVGMPRKDYERFLREAPALLNERYFLQNHVTDPNWVSNFSKIRDSRTTFIESSVKKFSINHGVYIDIFPLDYHDKADEEKFFRKFRRYTRRIGLSYWTPGIKQKIKKCLISFIPFLCCPSLKKTVLKRENLMKRNGKTPYIANYCGAWGRKEIIPAAWYGDGVVLNFEGMNVIAPSNYDAWLTQVYGEYMKLPPEEKRKPHHYTEIVDLEKSYKNYCEGML